SCERTERCITPVAAIQEVTIVDVEPRGAYCAPSEATTSRCYCSGLDSTFSFDVETDQISCETTSLNCGKDVDVQATDHPTCVHTSQNTAEGSCWADLDCASPPLPMGAQSSPMAAFSCTVDKLR